jgi:RimJ/RimL family protein N-acetyltransferase
MLDPAFHGDAVDLRPFEPSDVPALALILNHPGLTGRRYVPWGFAELSPLSQGQVEAIIQKWAKTEKGLQLAVVLRETEELIGHVGCDWGWDPHCPDLSLVIAPAHQRRGYGSEVLRLLLSYLFGNTVAHNVSGWVADWNRAGLQFATRHGFQECGRLRRAGIQQGSYFDVVVVDLLRPEWEPTGGTEHAT